MSEQGTKDIFEEILENAPAIRNKTNQPRSARQETLIEALSKIDNPKRAIILLHAFAGRLLQDEHNP